MWRYLPFVLGLVLLGLCFVGYEAVPWLALPGVVFGIITVVGLYDLFQPRHSIWRNYPLVGRVRWVGEALRPFLRAYIVESETEGRPFSHEERAVVYRRSKDVSSVEPFGSQLDIESPPYEWLSHSIAARHPEETDPRVRVGAPGTARPYSASVFNISAMSFGALGARPIEALSRGAAMGGFFHNTGEGGVSRYHLEGGGDLVWQIGSGYFGARSKDGGFDPDAFQETAGLDAVRMIEIKLSQGAKPGHGGVLPGSKVTGEIAKARGIPRGETCFSPPAHSAFSCPSSLLDFVAQLRELSGGKPVGLKLCVGNPWEVFAIVKASLSSGIRPDYIVVDGGEGGTGAGPGEFQDHVGMPLRQGLVLVRNALVGAGLKDEIRLAASGKQTSAFSLAASMALGADWVNTARGFMFSLGCIQSLNCHNNTCPTGIATTDPTRQRGLVVSDKAPRVANFQRNTVKALMEVVGAAGCCHPSELQPHHIMHRVTEDIARPGQEAYQLLEPGVLLAAPEATHLARHWEMARADSFAAAV